MSVFSTTTKIINRLCFGLSLSPHYAELIFGVTCATVGHVKFLFTSHLMHEIYACEYFLANILHNICADQFNLHILCKLYTHCVNFYTYCVNICASFGISKHSRCFVANLPLFQFRCVCVKSWDQKLRSGKSFDKYHI